MIGIKFRLSCTLMVRSKLVGQEISSELRYLFLGGILSIPFKSILCLVMVSLSHDQY